MAGLARLCTRSLQKIRSSPSRGMVGGNIHGLEGGSAGLRWASSNAAANVDDQVKEKSGEISVTRDQGQRDSQLAHRRRRNDSLWGNQNFGLTDLFPRLGFRDGILQWADNLQRMVDEMVPGQLFGRVKESDKAYKVKLEVPGLAKEDLKITIEEGNSLLIEGEHKEEEDNTGSDEEWGYRRRYGYYQTRLALPQDAESEEIKAKLKNGMPYITIPKAEEGKKKKNREIKVE